MTNSKNRSSKPNKYFASISSRHLLTRVAESIDILDPMLQLGCFNACSLVTPFRLERLLFKKGPPDAVIIILETSSVFFSPAKH